MASGPADKALDVFKSLIWDRYVDVATTAVIALAPFLAFPPLAFLIRTVFKFVGDSLYKYFSLGVNIEVIMLRNELNHKAFVDAEVELKRIADSTGTDSAAFKEAREKHKAALAKFVRYTGT